jgi:uncharacterized protein YcgI (DUF1989 family)
MMTQFVIEGGKGKALRLAKGQALKLVNTHGTQTVDAWALRDRDVSEYLSVEHTRRMPYRLYPSAGDILYTNRRTPRALRLGDPQALRTRPSTTAASTVEKQRGMAKIDFGSIQLFPHEP